MDIKLGKLRQWAGDVISSRDKSGSNDEFRDLEKDIELRKEGISRLIVASHAYQHALSKRKTSEAITDGDKFLPIDTLGIVMIQHGEQFGEESTFGSALTKLGSAHCKIATIQEAYALTFKDTFLASMERFKDEIKESELLRKKLDSRRSASESASAKYEKLQHSKKEKDRREAEDEMERAKQRYEETAEDLRAHMHAIQENEHNQLRELTALIDLETNYIQNYLDVLKDVKGDWQDRAPLTSSRSRPRSQSARSIQNFSRSATPRTNGNSGQNGRSRADSTTSTDSSEENELAPKRSGSIQHRRKDSNASTKSNKIPSRSSSRLSRKRKDSTASVSVKVTSGDDKDAEKEKEKKDDKSKRQSMAEWASTAMGSVTGSKSKKNKADKDSFATLEEDGPPGRASNEFGTTSSRASSSFLSLSRLTSKATSSNASSISMPPNSSSSSSPSQSSGKILKPPSLQGRKIVKALHDFNGSSDELSFKAGTEIVVVNEVLDDWWMGEVDGRTGLFPTSYTEVIVPTSPTLSSSVPSALVTKSPKMPGLRLRRGSSGRRSATSTPKNAAALLPLANEKKVESDSDHNRFLSSDADDDDTRELSQFKPMMTQKSPLFYGGFGHESDSMATTDAGSAVEDSETEEEGRLGSKPGSITLADQRAVKKPSELDDDWVTFEGGSGTGLREQRPQPAEPVQPPTATPKQRTMSLSLLGNLGNSLKIPIVDPAQQPLISRSKSDDPSLASPTVTDSPIATIAPSASSGNIAPTSRGSPPRKIPPPPPPRRAPSHAPVVSPPVPLRRPGASTNNSNTGAGSLSSSNASLLGLSGSSLPSSRTSDALGYDRSPFESALELEVEGGSEGGKCDRFRQNPFKPKGMCSNCLQYHD
ncbi:hypothetical protein CPB83DRAFT_853775 [Crepidotus variabilis]|uniref:BAR-domain-containing protein n=1 Tax=Crepidotus variabilis TaxID=179855 RepID=A0A9P6JQF9_9AGAR|nr:hypothetical protein CPB83DRAFT_853775 [Crepidotus variabilis]